MSKLKTLLNMRPHIKNFGPWSKHFRSFLNRTDHIVCESLPNNSVHSVFQAIIPISVGHWFTFNKNYFTPQQAKRKATSELKRINFKNRIYGNRKRTN